jgi:hypothetical protein
MHRQTLRTLHAGNLLTSIAGTARTTQATEAR